MIRWRLVLRIAEKELRDTLRDRRTLLMMVLVPALLYPVLGILMGMALQSSISRIQQDTHEVVVEGHLGEGVVRALERVKGLSVKRVPDAKAALSQQGQKGPPVGVVIQSKGPPDNQVRAEILYDSASQRAQLVYDKVRKALDDEAATQRKERLASLRLSEEALQPLLVLERSLSSAGRATLVHLAPALSMLLILLSLMGAFYPAIDLIAGERERGTLEPLLSTPTSRLEIITGKYLCLTTLTISACLLNLISLGGTTSLMLQRMAPSGVLLRPSLLLLLFVGALPVLFLVAALLLLAAVFARSFKDAQNLMTPVYLGCLLPTTLGLLPDLHLTRSTALYPVVSAVLFMKDAYGGTLTAVPALLCTLSGLFYSALAIAAATVVFERSAMVGMGIRDAGVDVLVGHAEDIEGARGLTLTGALGVFGLSLAGMIYVAPHTLVLGLRGSLLATLIGLVLLPTLLTLWATKLPVLSSLGIRPLPRGGVAASLLCAGGAIAIGLSISLLVVERYLHPPEEYIRQLRSLLPVSPLDKGVMLVIGALLPAICEEVLCRGLLFTAAKRTLGGAIAVLLSAALFSALHLDPYRMINTFVMGCLLGLLVLRTGTLIASMLVHFLNNATALLFHKPLERVLTGGAIVLGGALLLCGIALYLGGLRLVQTGEGTRKS